MKKKDDLDKVLLSANLPSPSEEYWKQFPKKVLNEIKRQDGIKKSAVKKRSAQSNK